LQHKLSPLILRFNPVKMMTTDAIETKRLRIIPLDYDALKKYLYQFELLEKELGLNASNRLIKEEIFEVITNNILPHVKKQKLCYIYHTLWVMIDKIKNVLVGDLLFKGHPNIYGQIEIGYGIYDTASNQGYMTEAVGGMIEWAKDIKEIDYITAETTQNNLPSVRVLEKNGFKKKHQSHKMFYWQVKTVRCPQEVL